MSFTTSDSGLDRFLRGAAIMLLPATVLFITTVAPVDEAKWTVVQLLAPTVAGLWVIRSAARGSTGLPWDPLSIVMYLGLGSMAISILPAVNPFMGLLELSKRFSVVCVYVLIASLMVTRRDRTDAAWVLVWTGIFGSVYAVAQRFGYDFFPWADHKFSPLVRGVSFFGHATFAASYVILVIPVAVSLIASPGAAWARAVAAVGVGLMLYHLSFSGARAASLGLVAGSGAAFLVLLTSLRPGSAGRETLRIPFWSVITIAFAAAALGGYLLLQAWAIKDSDLFAFRQASGALRIYTWETACRLFIEHPLLGIGTGNYEVIIPLHWNLAEASHFAVNGTIMHQAHNDYVETAAEQGLPGLIILVAMMLMAMAYAVDSFRVAEVPGERRLALGMFGSVVAGSVDAMFIFNLQVAASAIALWAIFGLIAAQRRDLCASRGADNTGEIASGTGNEIVQDDSVPA